MVAKTIFDAVIEPRSVTAVHFPGLEEDSVTEVTGVQVCRFRPRSRHVLTTCAASFQGYSEPASHEKTETALLMRDTWRDV